MDVGGTFTNAGGAFGFDTEASAGNTMPTRDSLDRFLTRARTSDSCGTSARSAGRTRGPTSSTPARTSGYTAIGRLGQYNTALWHRYGHWSGLASYEREAQAAGYEVTRAQFEAYIGQAHDRANPSTGLIYWQLNKAWPSLQWQLYGYDFDQAGVYFGAKKANESVHIMYAYSDGSIRVSNLTNAPQRGPACARRVPADRRRPARSCAPCAVPRVAGARACGPCSGPAFRRGMSSTYFLELTLTRGTEVVSRNVYWLSTTPDRIDWAATLGKGTGAVALPGGYADLTGLQRLAARRPCASRRRPRETARTT